MQPQHTMYPERFTRRFWTHVAQVSDEAACWPWLKVRDKDGYGLVQCQGRLRRAHRIAWELTQGRAVPAGLWILHRCNNPPCVNPAHLYAGTGRDNAQDRTQAGHTIHGDTHPRRQWPERTPRGSALPHARLTETTVRALREAYARGEGSHRALAQRFGMPAGTVSRVLSRRHWRHVL